MREEEGRERRERREYRSRAGPSVQLHKGTCPRPVRDRTQVPCQVAEESSSAMGFVLSEYIAQEQLHKEGDFSL